MVVRSVQTTWQDQAETGDSLPRETGDSLLKPVTRSALAPYTGYTIGQSVIVENKANPSNRKVSTKKPNITYKYIHSHLQHMFYIKIQYV